MPLLKRFVPRFCYACLIAVHVNCLNVITTLLFFKTSSFSWPPKHSMVSDRSSKYCKGILYWLLWYKWRQYLSRRVASKHLLFIAPEALSGLKSCVFSLVGFVVTWMHCTSRGSSLLSFYYCVIWKCLILSYVYIYLYVQMCWILSLFGVLFKTTITSKCHHSEYRSVPYFLCLHTIPRKYPRWLLKQLRSHLTVGRLFLDICGKFRMTSLGIDI